MNLDQLIQSLTNKEQQELFQILQNKISGEKFSLKLEETRFSTGLYCPRCGCIEPIVKCGQYKGKQRYACKSCGRIFTATSETFLSSTKKNLEIWLKYIQCMIRKMSLRKTASECQISLRTSFMWRHKILDALGKSQKVKLDGLIEADETFFRVSYKGSKPVDRETRRRAGSHKRGLSTDQVCVPCAIERDSKASFAQIGGLGKTSRQTLDKVLANRIKKNSIICTDKEKSYIRFAKENLLEHIRLAATKAKKGIYHIQNINGYHSRLKKFIDVFKGVSTKHLNNYLTWNSLIQERASRTSEQALRDEVLGLCFKGHGGTLYSAISSRPAVPA